MTTIYVSKDTEHDPGGELEPRKWCPGGINDGHYAPVSAFGVAPTRADGLRSLCRTCDRETQKARLRDENGHTKREAKQAERRELVRPYAEAGFNSGEIAVLLDNRWSKYTIQADIREMGLSEASSGGRRGAAPVSVLKKLEAASVALAGIARQLDQLRLHDVTFPEEAREWERELTKASYSVNRVRRQLKKGRNPS